jgi:MscS family membrane protein
VTIPNSTVAKEKIDNLTLRHNNIRFRFTLGFTYSSPIENIKRFCELLNEFLRSHQNIDAGRITVNIVEFAESSINVLVSYHYKFEDLTLENKVQQEHLIMIAKLADELKTEFAFPTRTLLISQPIADSAR